MNVHSYLRGLGAIAAAATLWLGQTAHGVVIADSVADFPVADNVTSDGKQNTNNWQYGFHQDTVAGAGFSYNAGSFIPFPDNQGPGTSPTDFWTGSAFDVHAGNPPWTVIGQTAGHPNNQATGGEQWAVRRYISEETGSANVEFHLHKTSLAGDGTTVRLFHNGVAVGESSFAVAGNDGVGKTWSVHVPNLKAGDTLDLALDYVGLTGSSDGSDGSSFSMKVDQVATSSSFLLADSKLDFPTGNDSAPKQGTNGWFYGRHNVTANGGDGYQAGDFIAFNDNVAPGLVAGVDDWNGIWDRNGGANPPWTSINADGGHPNGSNNAGAAGEGESWIIRRWVVDLEEGTLGDIVVDSFFAKQNTAAGNNGVFGRIFLNGIEVYTQFIAATDGQGFNFTTLLQGVNNGDLLDFVIDANGADGSDGSFFNARIYQLHNIPEPGTALLALMGVMGISMRRRRAA